jgi:hypothetical protein
MKEKILLSTCNEHGRVVTDWTEPPAFSDYWETSLRLSDLRERTHDLVHWTFAGYVAWG